MALSYYICLFAKNNKGDISYVKEVKYFIDMFMKMSLFYESVAKHITSFLKLQLVIYMKKIFLFVMVLLLVSCSNDDGVFSTTAKSRLFAVERIEDSNNRLVSTDIVEIDIKDGTYISTLRSFPPLQAHLDYNFTYLSSTNQLLIRHNVYEGSRGNELIKVNIDSKEEIIISSDDINNIIAVNDGRLFALKRIFNNTLLSIDLVEVNPEDGSVVSTLESFKALDNAPNSNKTGVTNMFYSKETDQLIIPRRISFVSNALDDLIKINIHSKEKTVINTKNYKAMIAGNGRLFALKHVFDNTNAIISLDLIELNINDGSEIETLAAFENWNSIKSEMIYLNETNEIILNRDPFNHELIKVNINSKESSTISIQSYLAVRGINLN